MKMINICGVVLKKPSTKSERIDIATNLLSVRWKSFLLFLLIFQLIQGKAHSIQLIFLKETFLLAFVISRGTDFRLQLRVQSIDR